MQSNVTPDIIEQGLRERMKRIVRIFVVLGIAFLLLPLPLTAVNMFRKVFRDAFSMFRIVAPVSGALFLAAFLYWLMINRLVKNGRMVIGRVLNPELKLKMSRFKEISGLFIPTRNYIYEYEYKGRPMMKAVQFSFIDEEPLKDENNQAVVYIDPAFPYLIKQLGTRFTHETTPL